MVRVLKRCGRLLPGLVLLCLSIPAQAQLETETETDTDPPAAESSVNQPSVYETLMFDRPYAVGAESESARQRRRAVEALAQEPADTAEIPLTLDLQQFQDAINSIQYEGGGWDLALTENLASMGDIYQRQGRFQEAADAYNRAMHISRVNLGLYSLEHVPVVERLIESHLALGDLESANQYHDYLYYAQRREYGLDDPRMVPVLERLASWKLSLFNAGWGDQLGLNLIVALRLYRMASDLVSVHFGPEDPRFEQYLRDTAGTAYLISRNQPLINETPQPQYRLAQDLYPDQTRGHSAIFEEGYEEGLEALQSMVDSFPEAARNSVEYAQALILEADWYLLFDRRRSAHATYLEAYEILLAQDDGETLAREIFGAPRPLPDFSEELETIFVTRNFVGRLQTARELGEVDVQFDVTSYGAVTNLEVLVDEEETVDDRVLSSLRRRVRATVFRPVIENGEVVRSNGNRFRYRYVY